MEFHQVLEQRLTAYGPQLNLSLRINNNHNNF